MRVVKQTNSTEFDRNPLSTENLYLSSTANLRNSYPLRETSKNCNLVEWCGGESVLVNVLCEFLYLRLFRKNSDSNRKFFYTNCAGKETFRMRYFTLLHRPVTFTYEYFLKPTPPPNHPEIAILGCSTNKKTMF